MKKNSGEKNERKEEFPNGRENEKKEREKKKTHQGLMNRSVLNTHHSKGWGKKMFVMVICFHIFYRSRERERIYIRG